MHVCTCMYALGSNGWPRTRNACINNVSSVDLCTTHVINTLPLHARLREKTR